MYTKINPTVREYSVVILVLSQTLVSNYCTTLTYVYSLCLLGFFSANRPFLPLVNTWTNYLSVKAKPNKKKISSLNELKEILLEPPFTAIHIIISDGMSGFLSSNFKLEIQKTLGHKSKTHTHTHKKNT